MKKEKKIFWRSAALSAVIVSCVLFGMWGVGKAYENTRRIAYGDYRRAVEYSNGVLRILDFEIAIQNNE